MSNEPEMRDPINVSAGEITVEKSFVVDEFPVPAVKFVITSESPERVDIRLTDNVPESFPMDCVGFHPDYDNDHWTAYQDHRVEFIHTLEPNEELTTVYGVRIGDADVSPDAFLDEPYLDLKSTNQSGGSEAEGVQDIIGENNNEVVRDVLSGESDTVPGMDESEPDFDDVADEYAVDDDDSDETLDLDDPLADDDADADDGEVTLDLEDPTADEDEVDEADDDAVADSIGTQEASGPEPRSLDDDTLPAVVERPEDAALLRRVDDTEAEAEADATDDELDEEAVAEDEAETDAPELEDGDEVSDDATPDEESPVVAADTTEESDAPQAVPDIAAGGIAAALATEIRNDRVDEEDLALLKRELDIGVPNSVDVRIHRLQSQMDDLEVYSDALEEFIDEEGTGEQLISDFRSEVAALSESLDALEAAVDGAEADRTDLRNEVEGVEAVVTDVEARVDATADELAVLSEEVAELSTLPEDVDALGGTVDSLDNEMGDVRADVADLDGEIVEAREDLEAQLADLREELHEDLRGDIDEFRTELDSIHSDIEELDEFRDRLGSAFGAN